MTRRREAELLAIVSAPPGPSSDASRTVMRSNRRRDTGPEVLLRRELHRRGLRFRVDHGVRVPGHRLLRPDVVFTRARVAVFVDGCFWHGCPEHFVVPAANRDFWLAKIELNQTRDRRQTAALEAGGWRVLRAWEHEAPTEAADRVNAAVLQAAKATGAMSAARTS